MIKKYKDFIVFIVFCIGFIGLIYGMLEITTTFFEHELDMLLIFITVISMIMYASGIIYFDNHSEIESQEKVER